ncbi:MULTISPECIES: molybdate ABC transporter substrate-binding protein [Clostridia]|uniref:Molybdate ABC transporter substrate-binding protein n=2 Tax=Clostridia TaxID=186801 RepID=A0A8I0A6A6_9CLOT|nr:MULTISPECIES: molybdate ABC transporter substrate-binding protein [Clostridia]MBC5639870.1 molybdate ABC transporter substrate-binding protein [Clostridium lentum]MBC5654101.1 molybdate ABC transporter substrate-binding protein [Blautia lenta]MEE0567337.1 molybdate ABC transporter substrate-binding protein [Clostridium sp.]OKZ88218.1 MAG: molybdate ABC transporter substrate-binding protein [Clostridium sp. 29_15]
MIKRLKFLSTLCCLSLLLTGCSSSTKKEDKTIELNISAAASLKEAMADLEAAYTSKNPEVSFVINYGSSGSLQQQIEQGAPCDLFISAGEKQMTALEEEGLLLDGTNKDLVKNSLVLVTSNDSEISSIDSLNSDAVSKIALGEPSSVPAGKYADETLTSLAIKDSLNNKLVFAKDVKEVLAWTASGNADAGFVYLSDALSSDGVKIVETISEEYHSPITYPVAIIKDSDDIDAAKAFEDFLFTDEAQEIFEKYGYKSVE